MTGPSALVLAVLLPDRLPSLLVLVGFWIPPAVVGWAAAGALARRDGRRDGRRGGAWVRLALAIFVLAYAATWFRFNLGRMPPYIPGALPDPTVAPPRAVVGLAVVAEVLVLPGSALACALAFRRRRALDRAAATPVA